MSSHAEIGALYELVRVKRDTDVVLPAYLAVGSPERPEAGSAAVTLRLVADLGRHRAARLNRLAVTELARNSSHPHRSTSILPELPSL